MNELILTLWLMSARPWWPECNDGWRATKGVLVNDCINGVWERNVEEEFKAVQRAKKQKAARG